MISSFKKWHSLSPSPYHSTYCNTHAEWTAKNIKYLVTLCVCVCKLLLTVHLLKECGQVSSHSGSWSWEGSFAAWEQWQPLELKPQATSPYQTRFNNIIVLYPNYGGELVWILIEIVTWYLCCRHQFPWFPYSRYPVSLTIQSQQLLFIIQCTT